jgi:Arm DNA-binding domain
MRKELTDIVIQSSKPGVAQYAIGDLLCPGLRIRIMPTGVKSFTFAYRSKATGKKVTDLTIGRYPEMPLWRAREIANDARKTVTEGGTPMAPTAKQRVEAQKKLRPTPTWSRSTMMPIW